MGDYDVFQLIPSEEEGKYYASKAVINPNDSWIDKKAVKNCCGKAENDEELVANIVEYYGMLNCCCCGYHATYPNTIKDLAATRDEVIDWMKAIGAEEFCREEVK